MKRKRGWFFYPLIIVALLLCALPAYADIPALPHPFYGTLTIDDSAAPVGTVVTAKVGEVECGSITTTVEGQYGGSGAFDEKLNVSGEIADGATIYFYAGTNVADQTYAFDSGADPTELNLTVTPAPDITPPTVVSTLPVADAIDVGVDTTVSVTFSEAMASSTITTGSFTLDSVSGSVAYDSGSYTATFTPDANLEGSTTYTATLSTAITDAAGNPLASAYSWSFTTADVTAPTVVSTSPEANETGVAVDTAVSATFSEAMDESTITASSFTLVVQTMTSISGTISYDSGTNTATFTPSVDLAENTTYTAALSTAITDAAGNPLASTYSWSFTTADITAPTVVSTSPEAGAIDVATYTTVTATFDMAMDESTITTSSFTLDGVSGSVSYDSGTYTATFTPDANLAENTTYTATLSTAITDAAGNPLAAAYSWSFTTVLVGDATGEGLVDARDITKVERIIAGLDAATPGADATQDGLVDARDITMVERIIAGLE